jgi:hypothetical protein
MEKAQRATQAPPMRECFFDLATGVQSEHFMKIA